MEVIVIAAFLGIIPGAIAHNKGRSFFLWWLFGAAIFIVALPVALLVSPNKTQLEERALAGGAKKCPCCAEMIKAEAAVCRHCGKEVASCKSA